MKKCPHCAEDIQDAALVCKHCRRDLPLPTPDRATLSGRDLLAVPPKPPNWGKRIVLAIVGLFLLGLTLAYCGPTHQRFADFSARRDAWHQRCDARRAAGRAADPAAYDACNTELNALVAEAKREGW